MKILKLALRNINSLYGSWEIDFTHPAYTGGLFAITGKTGAGKTTLLDAMMLALYAETPRISAGRNMEVVSRGTQDCFAELVFSAQDGHTYTASFAFGPYLRGPKKGQINEKYIHRLARNGENIADHTATVRKMVEEITGLDKSRFCRTVMLAQGQFDAFLGAGDDKAPILERITGTEIYTRIAAAVKVRFDKENENLALLRKECEQTILLSDEEVQNKQKRKDELSMQVIALQKESELLTEQKQAWDHWERISRAIIQNQQQQKHFTEEETAFQPDAQRLALAEKTEPLRPLILSLEKLKLENQTAEKEADALKEKLPALKIGLKKAEQKKTELTAEYDIKTEEQKALDEILKQVRELDHILSEKNQYLLKIRDDLSLLENDCAALLKQKQETENTLQILICGNNADIIYCREHAEDEVLPEKYAKWQEKLKHIENLKKIGTDAAAERKKAETDFQKSLQILSEKTQLKKLAVESLFPLRQNVLLQKEKLRQMDSREILEKQQDILMRNILLVQKILNLAEERRHLLDGEPCPLCGSISHPFQKEKLPEQQQNKLELNEIKQKLKNLSDQEKAVKTAETILQDAVSREQIANHQYEMAVQQKNTQEQQKNEKTALYEKLRGEYVQIVSELRLDLQKNGENWTGGVLPENIEKRISNYQQANIRREQFEKKKQSFEQELILLKARLDDKQNLLKTIREEQKRQKEIRAELLQKRTALFGEKNPDRENEVFNSELKHLVQCIRENEIALAQTAKDLEHTEQQFEKIRNLILQRIESVQAAESLYREKCAELEISPENILLLSPEELARLSAKKAELSEKKKNLDTEKETLNEELKKINLPEQNSREDIINSLTSVRTEWQKKSVEIGSLQNELEQNTQNKLRLTEKYAELEKCQKSVNLRGRLYNLIGRGNQFQRIAQGITLDNLLTLANEELEHLYSRYELIRSDRIPLGIDVIDHEQGDEIRSCDNLSGGERFVVSLALALGLSRMAGEKIRVDSLFLDEGFGTLDAESLQIVMQALAKLKNNGKTVGIISHVSGLAEEIACNLELTVSGGGKSTLSGPGVTAL